MKILIVEDDTETAEYVVNGLKERGHTADRAADGHDGLFLARDGNYDVIVVDRMLPRLDGLSLVKTLRDSGLKTPTLFLTAMGSIEDRVKGLESGGDDYLVKPFAFSEFYARISALSRRPPLSEVQTILRAADLELDLVQRQVRRDNTPIELQATEFRLLEYFMRNAGKVLTRTMLLEAVWDFHFDPKTSIVETHVSRLRAKIDRGFNKELIKTVRGSGYRLDA